MSSERIYIAKKLQLITMFICDISADLQRFGMIIVDN
jgi:hypothetical protein